jgi:hypothetical protein
MWGVFVFNKKTIRKGGFMADTIRTIGNFLVSISYALGFTKQLPCDER